MKTIISFLILTFTLNSSAATSDLDDAISEKLAPLLSNYLETYQGHFEIVHVQETEAGKTTKNPVFLAPLVKLKGESLQDCEENPSSVVCKMAVNIEAWIAKTGVRDGTISLTITISQNGKTVEIIKDIELLSLK